VHVSPGPLKTGVKVDDCLIHLILTHIKILEMDCECDLWH
jgi:hypothetical protein